MFTLQRSSSHLYSLNCEKNFFFFVRTSKLYFTKIRANYKLEYTFAKFYFQWYSNERHLLILLLHVSFSPTVIPKRSKSNTIQGEIQARYTRVERQTENDAEIHLFLLRKVRAEADLAEFYLSSAKAEEERKKESYEKAQAFLVEMRKIELEKLQK